MLHAHAAIGMVAASAWRQMILYRLSGSEVSAPVRYLTHPLTLLAAQLIDNTPVLKIPTFAASSWLLWKNTVSQGGNMAPISTTTAIVTQVASVFILLCPTASAIRNLFIPLIASDNEFKRKEAVIRQSFEERKAQIRRESEEARAQIRRESEEARAQLQEEREAEIAKDQEDWIAWEMSYQNMRERHKIELEEERPEIERESRIEVCRKYGVGCHNNMDVPLAKKKNIPEFDCRFVRPHPSQLLSHIQRLTDPKLNLSSEKPYDACLLLAPHIPEEDKSKWIENGCQYLKKKWTEIKVAVHPDKFQGAEAKEKADAAFKVAQKAYETLCPNA